MRYDPISGFFRVYEGGGKGGTPDYAGAAAQQGAANKEVNTAATWANRPTINTPWGKQTWTPGQSIDPGTNQSVTNWTSNIDLTPEAQRAVNDQQAITAGRSNIARGLMGQVADSTATPFNWDGIPKAPGSLEEAQQGAFSKMSAMLQPGRAQQDSALDTKLANMGLPRNSEAWNRAKTQLQGQWTGQDQSIMAQALSEGRADVGTQQNMRNAAILEQAQRRGMSLNELNALLTGQQVSMPQGMAAAPNTTAGTAQAAPYMNAAIAQGNSPQGSDWGSALGGFASIASSLMKP